MNVNLHIDRIVLHDLPAAPGDRAALQRAIEAELAGLLQNSGLSDSLLAGGARASLPVSDMPLSPGVSAPQFGQQIAHAVYGAIGNA